MPADEDQWTFNYLQEVAEVYLAQTLALKGVSMALPVGRAIDVNDIMYHYGLNDEHINQHTSLQINEPGGVLTEDHVR